MTDKSLLGKVSQSSWAILIPIFGLVAMWICFMGAWVADLYITEYTNCGAKDCVLVNEQVHASVYLFWFGIALASLASLWGRYKAANAGNSRLAHASRGFTLIAVIASLIISAIAAIAVFMSHFSQSAGENASLSIFTTYIPVILYAVLVVFVILRAFVSKKGDEDDE